MTRSRALLLLLLLLSLALTACGATTNYTRSPDIAAAPVLAADTRLYVAVPADGTYGETVYTGSGRMTAEAVVAAFAPHAEAVAGEAAATEAQALALARENGCTHALVPQILHWEDRATEWSGRSDVIQVRLRMLAVPDQQLLDEVVIDGASSWWSFGGDHPQDLLPRPLRSYADALFGGDGERPGADDDS